MPGRHESISCASLGMLQIDSMRRCSVKLSAEYEFDLNDRLLRSAF